MNAYIRNFFSLLIFLILMGCGGNGPNQKPAAQPGGNNPLFAIHVLNPDDPESIKKWEESPLNVFSSKIHVVKLKYFHGNLGGLKEKAEKTVALEVSGAKVNGLTDAQRKTIDHLVKNESELFDLVYKAFYKEYKKNYPIYKSAFGGGAAGMKKLLPAIKNGNELDSIVQIYKIYIHEIPKEGLVAVGIEFSIPWDEEHDVGVRLLGSKIDEVGIAFTAYPLPLPKQNAKKQN